MLWYKLFLSWHARQNSDPIGLEFVHFSGDFERISAKALGGCKTATATTKHGEKRRTPAPTLLTDRCLNPSPKMQSCKSKEADPNLSCWKWRSGSRLTQICHSHENPPCTATTLMSFHFLCLENSSEPLRLSANTRGNKTSEIRIGIEQRALHKHTCGFLRLLKTQMSRGRTWF